MARRFHWLDVFTDRPFGGNPLAVVLDTDGLDGDAMATIARELNLSETVFVLPPEDPAHDRRLRIFTPGMELPFAGHPTVGTAWLLATLGDVPVPDGGTMVLEEGVGPVRVRVRRDGAGRPTFTQLEAAQRPERSPSPLAPADVAALVGLRTEDLAAGAPPEVASCGVPFLVVPVADAEALGRARLDLGRWAASLADGPAPHVYAVARGDVPGAVRVRMWAPAMGITEDPATGAAASALAGPLAAWDGVRAGTGRWTLAQGAEIGRPSRLEVEADVDGDGAVTAVRVGGATVAVAEGTLVAAPPSA